MGREMHRASKPVIPMFCLCCQLIADSLIRRFSGSEIWILEKKAQLRKSWKLYFILGLCIHAVSTVAIQAQELEPRAYASSPVGLTAVVGIYGNTSGSVLMDPTLPVEDVTASVKSVSLGYFKSFGFFGRSANLSVGIPYVWGDMKGLLAGEFTRITRSGLGDMRLRLAANLVGAPAMKPAEFARYRQTTNLGLSVTVAAPIGQYDSAKLINIGANRWALKPEIGLSHARGKWLMEVAGGVWFFSENSSFLGQSYRKQDPLLSIQGHVIYNLSRRMWLAFNANFYQGGASSTNGGPTGESFQNSRLGLTYSLEVARGHSLKFGFSDGAMTRLGGDFRSVTVGYQYVFLK